MTEIRVRWTQRVMGRYPGDEETIEHTPLVDALAAQNRLDILETLPYMNDLGQVLEDVHVDLPVIDVPSRGDGSLDDLPAAVSEVEFEIPKPRPRAPRKPVED